MAYHRHWKLNRNSIRLVQNAWRETDMVCLPFSLFVAGPALRQNPDHAMKITCHIARTRVAPRTSDA